MLFVKLLSVHLNQMNWPKSGRAAPVRMKFLPKMTNAMMKLRGDYLQWKMAATSPISREKYQRDINGRWWPWMSWLLLDICASACMSLKQKREMSKLRGIFESDAAILFIIDKIESWYYILFAMQLPFIRRAMSISLPVALTSLIIDVASS